MSQTGNQEGLGIRQDQSKAVDTDVGSAIAIGEIQLVLAEKRTSLALLRTGLAVLVLPLSILSVLVATSRYYSAVQVLYLLAPILAICAFLVFLGLYLIVRAIRKIQAYDRLIAELKARYGDISGLIE